MTDWVFVQEDLQRGFPSAEARSPFTNAHAAASLAASLAKLNPVATINKASTAAAVDMANSRFGIATGSSSQPICQLGLCDQTVNLGIYNKQAGEFSKALAVARCALCGTVFGTICLAMLPAASK